MRRIRAPLVQAPLPPIRSMAPHLPAGLLCPAPPLPFPRRRKLFPTQSISRPDPIRPTPARPELLRPKSGHPRHVVEFLVQPHLAAILPRSASPFYFVQFAIPLEHALSSSAPVWFHGGQPNPFSMATNRPAPFPWCARRLVLRPRQLPPASDTSARLPLPAASSSVGAGPQQQGASHGVCFPNARPVNSRQPRAAAATPVRAATWISLASCPRRARCNAKAAVVATPSVASCSLDRATRRRSVQPLRAVVKTHALVDITPRASLVGKDPKLMACMCDASRSGCSP